MQRHLATRLPKAIEAVAEVATAATTVVAEGVEATEAKADMVARADTADKADIKEAKVAEEATQEATKVAKAVEEAAEATVTEEVTVTVEATKEVATEAQAVLMGSLPTKDAAVVGAPTEAAPASQAWAAMKVATSSIDQGHLMSLSKMKMASSRRSIEVAVVVEAIMATTTTAVVAAEEAATPSAEEMVRSTVTQVSSGSSPRPKTQLSQQLQPLTTLEPLITSLQRVTPVTLSK